MRLLLSRGSWVALLLSAPLMAGAVARGPGKDAQAERVAALVNQLGDRKFAKREEASRGLVAFGERALPALLDAVDASEHLEIRRRAQQAVRTIMLRGCRSKSLGLEMVVIDAGEFSMGSPNTEAGRRPDESQHRVRITRPFLLGTYEVAQDEYRQVMKTNPSGFHGQGAGRDRVVGINTNRFPVENVTWYDAIEFCNLLSKQDGYETYYNLTEVKREAGSIRSAVVTVAGGNGYRLPTEAEWERACRAATTTRYHFGNETKTGLINCKPLRVAGGYGTLPKWPDLGRTARVGSFPPNALGLLDMHGNVAEWCWDWYDKDYYDRSPRDDPRGPDRGTHRVLRGGSWMVSEESCRSASRFFHPPDERKDYAGFRVARTPGPPRTAGK